MQFRHCMARYVTRIHSIVLPEESCFHCWEAKWQLLQGCNSHFWGISNGKRDWLFGRVQRARKSRWSMRALQTSSPIWVCLKIGIPPESHGLSWFIIIFHHISYWNSHLGVQNCQTPRWRLEHRLRSGIALEEMPRPWEPWELKWSLLYCIPSGKLT